ncbi:hypothetical protein A3E46_02175 [Candidatus Woesebacteria bacterium RIFCSPHIGHO2_12_FULL_46_16]|uniref:Uncharacterized protein n=1 Tax=Candidatus Woesebacteria bacterium RIFCSPHIGHO2_12_FULL_46_16 TaxID=1802513 RepID=A0A1F8B057_9BACT|nr:MAG: hypothetical protein A3E46_02175 [Candidatus Woesebacteria bacterium RIFCSPHIGHO2_12_FULL_46_16]
MAATVEIDEENGNVNSTALTHNISNSNIGSTDASNLNPISNPIAPGANSFEKWQMLHVVDMGTSSKIENIRVWRSGSLGTNAIHLTNASNSAYRGEAKYRTPTDATSPFAVFPMPTSIPGSANLGIGGSLIGSLTESGSSDFLVHQIQTTEAALAGSTTVMNYSYDETA